MQAEVETITKTLRPLRKWQAEGITAARQILLNESKDHLYVCAPTASGKSRFMFETIERLTEVDGTHFIIVGLGPIKAQHWKSFEEFGCERTTSDEDRDVFVTPSGQQIVITTWQGLTRACLRGEDFGQVGFLFFDECHIGGSSDAVTSIPTIFNHLAPSKKVYVSATTQTANETLLGPKLGHMFFYSFKDAYEDDILHPVEMIEVHTGVRAQIIALEAATGRNMEDLEVLEGKDLHDLAQQFKDKQVDISGVLPQPGENRVSELVRQRHDSMSELYMARHPGEQAIFFSPSVTAAVEATARFNSLARQRGIDVGVAKTCYSDLSDTISLIEDFKAGKTRVIFVVGMLQEGYDHDTLALAFDCRFYRRWNGSRITRLIQKIGRIMRKAEGKPTSRYYYARDVSDFYRNSRLDDPSFPEVVETPWMSETRTLRNTEGSTAIYGISDADIAEEASIAIAALVQNIESEGIPEDDKWSQFCDGNPTTIDHIIIASGNRITTASTPLYVLNKLRGWTIVRQWNVGELFAVSRKEKLAAQQLKDKAALIECAQRGGDIMDLYSDDCILRFRFYQFTKHTSSYYDEELTIVLRKLVPRWFLTNKQRDEEDIARFTEDMTFFHDHRHREQDRFDRLRNKYPEFRKTISQNKQLYKERKRLSEIEEAKTLIRNKTFFGERYDYLKKYTKGMCPILDTYGDRTAKELYNAICRNDLAEVAEHREWLQAVINFNTHRVDEDKTDFFVKLVSCDNSDVVSIYEKNRWRLSIW